MSTERVYIRIMKRSAATRYLFAIRVVISLPTLFLMPHTERLMLGPLGQLGGPNYVKMADGWGTSRLKGSLEKKHAGNVCEHVAQGSNNPLLCMSVNNRLNLSQLP